MLEFIKNWVINIVALVLFIVIIEMLLPNGKMKKYAGIVTGTILIIAIATPLIGLIGKKFDFTAAKTATSNVINRMQIERESKLLEEKQLEQIIQVYRSDLIEQLEDQAEEVEGVRKATADIIINEDLASEHFGEIKRIYLEITPEGDNDRGDVSLEGDNDKGDSSPKAELSGRISKVETVNIEKIANKRTKIENCPLEDQELRKRLEERVGGVFGIEKNNIIITKVAG
jgi:stage III sporulation protein AF